MRFEWVFEALDIYFVQKKYPVSQSIFLLLKPHWFHVKILCNYLGRCDRSPRIAKSPHKPLANPSYANLGVIEALASTDARRGTCYSCEFEIVSHLRSHRLTGVI